MLKSMKENKTNHVEPRYDETEHEYSPGQIERVRHPGYGNMNAI